MRVRISIFLVILLLVTWTGVSVLILSLTFHPCSLHVAVPPGGFPNGVLPTMTQAEMDAQTAACNAPQVRDFFIPAVGYTVIVGLGVASAIGPKRDASFDP